MRYGWTLEIQEWDKLLKLAAETQWSRVNLRALDRDSVPETPGVYLICVKIPKLTQRPFGKLYNVIYVGMTESSLKRRFLEHCSSFKTEALQAKQCFGEIIDYWYCTIDSVLVAELEACLIDCLGPTVNKIAGLRARIGTPVRA